MSYFEENKVNLFATQTTTRIGEKFNICIELSNELGFVSEAKIIMNQQNGSNQREYKMEYISTKNNISSFGCNVILNQTGIHYYCFKITINGVVKWMKLNPNTKKACLIENGDFPYWSITAYEKNFCVPDWAKGRTMYHIFVDRFYKSDKYTPNSNYGRTINKWGEMPIWFPNKRGEILNDDFFAGNLKGIEEKMQYIKNLGVEILYLSPICRSQSNHRYDTADYEEVDPFLGTNQDLADLCVTAHKNGMKVIIDAVFNHTGNDSKYFNEFGTYDTIGACKGKKSNYYNWYKKKPNGDFEYWWGFKNLPVCDGSNPNWQNFIYGENGVIDKWFKLGIDGLRLDVADELTDEFIENIRNAVKRNKSDGFILGEVWDNAITKEGYGKQRTYLLGKGLDSVMNYPFTNAILKYVRYGNYNLLTDTIDEILNMYPKEVIYSLMNSLSTHDITRAMTTLVGEGIPNNKFGWIWDVPYSRDWQYQKDKLNNVKYIRAKQLLQIATIIQYFLPGNPCLFYGDEAGLYGYKDPFNRKCFPWENIDNELYEFFCQIGQIKQKYDFLQKAEIRIIQANEKIFMFERYDKNNKMLIAINRSEHDIPICIKEEYVNGNVIFNINSSENMISKLGAIIIVSK